MKVLHIISSGGMYGAEAVILNLSRALNEGSHSSVLGVFSNASNPNLQLHEAAIREGIESHLIPCSGQFDWTVTARIRELAASTGADVVHAHGYKADVYVYFALRGTKTPFVSTCHSWYDNDLVIRLYGMVDRRVLRNYAGIVAVSEEVKQGLLRSRVPHENVYLIKNGIDLRPFDKRFSLLWEGNESGKAPIIGLVGRLAREKGIDIFLHAAAKVLVQYPAAKFVVIGEGPDWDKLNSIIAELKIQMSVSLLGRREDMPEVYASLDMMVSSSRQEGLPMAILEGMASGLPIVATAVGDVPVVIVDGCTGILVPSADVDLLAAGIVKLLRDPALGERLGDAARKLIEDEFSSKRMAADYLHVYESVAASEKIGTGESQLPASLRAEHRPVNER